MRFKTRIKGLRPEVFELAAELLDSGELRNGACEAIFRVIRVLGRAGWPSYETSYHRLMEEYYKPETVHNSHWFGPTWYDVGPSPKLQHRVISLLLLAQMIRYANK